MPAHALEFSIKLPTFFTWKGDNQLQLLGPPATGDCKTALTAYCHMHISVIEFKGVLYSMLGPDLLSLTVAV